MKITLKVKGLEGVEEITFVQRDEDTFEHSRVFLGPDKAIWLLMRPEKSILLEEGETVEFVKFNFLLNALYEDPDRIKILHREERNIQRCYGFWVIDNPRYMKEGEIFTIQK